MLVRSNRRLRISPNYRDLLYQRHHGLQRGEVGGDHLQPLEEQERRLAGEHLHPGLHQRGQVLAVQHPPGLGPVQGM